MYVTSGKFQMATDTDRHVLSGSAGAQVICPAHRLRQEAPYVIGRTCKMQGTSCNKKIGSVLQSWMFLKLKAGSAGVV